MDESEETMKIYDIGCLVSLGEHECRILVSLIQANKCDMTCTLRAVEQIIHVTSLPNPGIKSHPLRKLFTCLNGNQL